MIAARSRHQGKRLDLEDIYREHFAFVWSVLRRLGVADHDLEDVVQDVFVVVHRRLGDFEGRAAMRTWLYAIAVRVVLNYRRRARYRQPADASSSQLVAPLTSDPEEHAVRSQASAVLDRLLERLDDDKRVVFVLSELEGLTALQIAEIVGANPRTVYSRLRAARDRVHGDLARLLAREQAEHERRAWLRHAAAERRPGAGTERRIWAAIGVKLSVPGAATAATAVGTLTQAVTVSIALGLGGLGTLFVVTSPLRADAGARGTGARAVDVDDPSDVTPARGPTMSARSNDAIAADGDDDELARTRDGIDATAGIADPRNVLDPAARHPSGRAHDQARAESPSFGAATGRIASPLSHDATDHLASPRARDATDHLASSRARDATDHLASSRSRDATDHAASPLAPGANEPAAGSPDALAEELAILDPARAALARGDAAAVLTAADAHAHRFPNGALRRDRERMRIQALCDLGRTAEAAHAAASAKLPNTCP